MFQHVWQDKLPGTSRLGKNAAGARVAPYTAALMCLNDECGAVVGALVTNAGTLLDYWPKEIPPRPSFPDVPAHIAEAAAEAHYVNALKAHRAAGALARAVIEATAKERGITEGKIKAKIEEMAKRGLIREDTKEAAHEVRHFGNEMAHGDFVYEVDPDEAADILDLMDEVLAEVYQSRKKVERVRERRKAREEKQKQEQSVDAVT